MMLYIPLKIGPASQIEKSGSQLVPKQFGQLWALIDTVGPAKDFDYLVAEHCGELNPLLKCHF